MAAKTRKEHRMEIENFKALVFERLEGRDIQEAVFELIQKAEDVCIDEVGMPDGWWPDNEDHQMAFFDIVAEQLRLAYFSTKEEQEKLATPTIDEI